MKQPSPCCAAASVAGAYNALHVFHRNDPSAHDFRTLCNLLAKHCGNIASQKRKGLERMLEGYLRGLAANVKEV